MNPLLVAAAKFELDPLTNTLQARGHTPESRLTGVGALQAAKRTKQIADACRGRDVIFVGTCGAFTGFSRVTLIRATDVIWSPTCERLGMSYTVKDSAPPINLPAPPAWAAKLPERKVLCSPAISLVSRLPEGCAADQYVENLELYSCIGDIAQTAASLVVILAMTNSIGPDAHAEWRQHFAVAAGMAAEYIGSRIS